MSIKAKVALVSLALAVGLNFSQALPNAEPGDVRTGVIEREDPNGSWLRLNVHPQVCQGRKRIYIFRAPYEKTEEGTLNCDGSTWTTATVEQQ